MKNRIARYVFKSAKENLHWVFVISFFCTTNIHFLYLSIFYKIYLEIEKLRKDCEGYE